MPHYRILIVDDQKDIRRLLSTGLSMLQVKMDVVEVPSAEEAILVARGAFDLMIADIRLPGISGLDLFRRIHKQHPQMKIILITGLTDPEIREEVKAAGAEAFFYKPVDLDEFLRKVEELLDIPLQPANQELLTLEEHLDDLRQNTHMDRVAVMDHEGKVIAQAGSLQAQHLHADLQDGFAHLHAAGINLSNLMSEPDPVYYFYLAGKDNHFYLASLSSAYLLVLTARQPFQHRLGQLNQVLQDAGHHLGRFLPVDRSEQGADHSQQNGLPEASRGAQAVPETTAGPSKDDPNSSLAVDDELVNAEISAEELAVVNALFEPTDREKIKPVELDEFWDSLAQEEITQEAGDGSISYDDALDMGLAPD